MLSTELGRGWGGGAPAATPDLAAALEPATLAVAHPSGAKTKLSARLGQKLDARAARKDGHQLHVQLAASPGRIADSPTRHTMRAESCAASRCGEPSRPASARERRSASRGPRGDKLRAEPGSGPGAPAPQLPQRQDLLLRLQAPELQEDAKEASTIFSRWRYCTHASRSFLKA